MLIVHVTAVASGARHDLVGARLGRVGACHGHCFGTLVLLVMLVLVLLFCRVHG